MLALLSLGVPVSASGSEVGSEIKLEPSAGADVKRPAWRAVPSGDEASPVVIPESEELGPQAKVVWGAAKQSSGLRYRQVTIDMTWSTDVPAPAPKTGDGVSATTYASFIGLQMLDMVTTRAAVSSGAFELNPLMRLVGAAGPGGITLKAATTAITLYRVKKLAQKNPAAARAAIDALNAATVEASLNNLTNIR